MEKKEFALSAATFYVKAEVTQPNSEMVEIKIPNTILTFIPLGKKTISVPISQIASVGTDFKLSLGELLGGGFLALIGLSTISDAFSGKVGGFSSAFMILVFGLILAAAGACIAINAFHVYLLIRNNSGEVVGSEKTVEVRGKKGHVSNPGIPVLFFHRSAAEEIATELNALVSMRSVDTNVRIQNNTMNSNTQAIIDAINSSKQGE